MRDIYIQAKNSVSEIAVPAIGNDIDRVRKCIVESIQVAYRHCDKLMSLGCVHAHIHFKADGKTMFMNKPAGEDGKRTYIHVGTRPEKQEEARAKVQRELQRQRLVEAAERVVEKGRSLDQQLTQLLWHYERLEKEAEELKTVINEQNEPQVAQEQAFYER